MPCGRGPGPPAGGQLGKAALGGWVPRPAGGTRNNPRAMRAAAVLLGCLLPSVVASATRNDRVLMEQLGKAMDAVRQSSTNEEYGNAGGRRSLADTCGDAPSKLVSRFWSDGQTGFENCVTKLFPEPDTTYANKCSGNGEECLSKIMGFFAQLDKDHSGCFKEVFSGVDEAFTWKTYELYMGMFCTKNGNKYCVDNLDLFLNVDGTCEGVTSTLGCCANTVFSVFFDPAFPTSANPLSTSERDALNGVLACAPPKCPATEPAAPAKAPLNASGSPAVLATVFAGVLLAFV